MTEIHESADLDRLDRRILAILQQDGRIANVDLAERVGLSATATAERVKRLARDGVITGWHARLDPQKLGLDMLFFVEVTLERTTADVFAKFDAAVRRAPEVLECHLIAGGFDYLVKARAPDMAHYRRFLGEVLLALPGVRATHTYPVMEEVKAEAGLPV